MKISHDGHRSPTCPYCPDMQFSPNYIFKYPSTLARAAVAQWLGYRTMADWLNPTTSPKPHGSSTAIFAKDRRYSNGSFGRLRRYFNSMHGHDNNNSKMLKLNIYVNILKRWSRLSSICDPKLVVSEKNARVLVPLKSYHVERVDAR
ncbi:hypothetical protein TNCV_4887691 [Trichonephila clavipes]|nr:hypothetical protein TNCV_4887691 [Trichonephila clavipes]